jgi:hypothetical protein
MFEFEKMFPGAPKGVYEKIKISPEVLDVKEDSPERQLLDVLDVLPNGAWIAGSAAMAIHDRLVPPTIRVINKGSFNEDRPVQVAPKTLGILGLLFASCLGAF